MAPGYLTAFGTPGTVRAPSGQPALGQSWIPVLFRCSARRHVDRGGERRYGHQGRLHTEARVKGRIESDPIGRSLSVQMTIRATQDDAVRWRMSTLYEKIIEIVTAALNAF